MRISDWSSDVCSADLHDRQIDVLGKIAEMRDQPGLARAVVIGRDQQCGIRTQILRHLHVPQRSLRIVADRKSVVSGKSVSVRVDLGGRGMIKKKNIHLTLHYHNTLTTKRTFRL